MRPIARPVERSAVRQLHHRFPARRPRRLAARLSVQLSPRDRFKTATDVLGISRRSTSEASWPALMAPEVVADLARGVLRRDAPSSSSQFPSSIHLFRGTRPSAKFIGGANCHVGPSIHSTDQANSFRDHAHPWSTKSRSGPVRLQIRNPARKRRIRPTDEQYTVFCSRPIPNGPGWRPWTPVTSSSPGPPKEDDAQLSAVWHEQTASGPLNHRAPRSETGCEFAVGQDRSVVWLHVYPFGRVTENQNSFNAESPI